MFLVVDNFEDGSRKHFLTSEFFKEHCVYCTLKTLKESYDKHVHKYIIDITSNKESSLLSFKSLVIFSSLSNIDIKPIHKARGEIL